MRIMSVGELKTNFSEVLKQVQLGEEIGIAYGKNKEIVAKLVPKDVTKKEKRKLGPFDKFGTVKFKDDFKMTEEEFLGL